MAAPLASQADHMGDVSSAPREIASVSATDDRLDSWKEIAAYLKRDVSTVQRWEKKEGLPVHRLPHDKLGSVFAFKPELDQWWNRGRRSIEATETEPRWQRTKEAIVDWRVLAGETLRASAAALRASWRVVLIAVLTLVATFAAGVIVMWRVAGSRAVETTSSPIQFAIPLPAGSTLAIRSGTAPTIAVSRDGKKVAYAVQRGARTLIYLRMLDRAEAEPVPGTEGGSSPFFSPDGQSLGFVIDQTKLQKVSLTAPGTVTLCETARIRGASWGLDGTIVFAPSAAKPLWTVSAQGGPCQPLTKLELGEHSHRLPTYMPDGRTFLFSVGMPRMNSWDEAAAVLLDPASGRRQRVLDGGMTPRYVPTGHLLYGRGGSLFAVGFDPDEDRLARDPVAVVSGIVTAPGDGDAHFAVSETGVLAYAAGLPFGAQKRLLCVDREGRTEPISEQRSNYGSPRLSPDGRHLAFSTDSVRTDIWSYDLTRGTMTRLTSEGLYNSIPVWTPDGQRVAYRSTAEALDRSAQNNTQTTLSWRAADGTNSPEPLRVYDKPGAWANPASWSPDGEILVLELDGFAGSDLGILRRKDKKIEPLLTGPFNERSPMISPDGRWLAYVSNESGRDEVYVRPFPGPGARWTISSSGGSVPRWSSHSRELFYREGPKLMAVAVQMSPVFSASRPTVLFENAGLLSDFDVTADGQRFVMIETSAEPAPTQIEVVVHWFEELKRKVPTVR